MSKLDKETVASIEENLGVMCDQLNSHEAEWLQELFASYKELTQFDNPKPVVVGLVPVRTDDGLTGLLTVRRNIEPGKGKLALPGGYLEIEDWRAGLSREIWEEIGIHVKPDEFVVHDVVSGRNNQVLLVFARSEGLIIANKLDPFISNHEVSERVIIHAPTELAFPAHTQAAKEFFDGL